jgi:vancomycin permeability regulator SanA
MRKSNWADLPLPIRSGQSRSEGRFSARWLSDALPRGLALFLGGFALLNIFGNLRAPGFDANLWWIDFRAVPTWLSNSLLLVSAFCLISFAFRPQQSASRRHLTVACIAVLGIVAALNAIEFYILWIRGSIRAGIPIPFSLFVCGALAMILFSRSAAVSDCPGRVAPSRRNANWQRDYPNSRKLLPVLTICLTCTAIFPFAQMLFFGKTDYRRPADIAVVLGARVYADGRPSDALADRVRTACKLYQNGTVKKLLFSGGPGDGSIHETEGMKRMAIQLGVKPEDILLDAHGVNTQATVKNTEAVFQQLHASRILVVSHFYHLPRIKLAYHREGWEVYTVPAKESYLLRQMPFNMAREVAALWVYYFRPLTARHTTMV